MATKKSKTPVTQEAPAKQVAIATAKTLTRAAKKAVKKSAAKKPAASASKTGKIKKTVKTKKGAPKATKPSTKPAKPAEKPAKKPKTNQTAQLLESTVVYEGKVFRVLHDRIIEPGGGESTKDIVRHNGSVVILAVDPGTGKGKSKKDPWIVMERQYRHAAGQFLWELPAGKLEIGEDPLTGAKRELAEETGYQSRNWSKLFEYYASPGFLAESMKVFLADGLVAGDAHPEEDEKIDFRLVKLSELLQMIDKGKFIDGKTLTTVLLYARQLGVKHKK